MKRRYTIWISRIRREYVGLEANANRNKWNFDPTSSPGVGQQCNRSLYSFPDRPEINKAYFPFFFFSFWGGVRLSPLGTSATNWPIVPAPDDRWWWMWSGQWNENWQQKPNYSEKTCPIATSSTTNPTWSDLGSKPVRRSGKPATNHLSYVTATYFPIELTSNKPAANVMHLMTYLNNQTMKLSLAQAVLCWIGAYVVMEPNFGWVKFVLLRIINMLRIIIIILFLIINYLNIHFPVIMLVVYTFFLLISSWLSR
jgi:hypothetical protein